MSERRDDFESEIGDLRKELENFQQEKERVRAIIGQIGGVPTFHTHLINWLFVGVVVISLGASFMLGPKFQLTMIELATVAISAKIMYMIHCQSKVNHFQVWMQSSLEWRINEMMKILRKIDKDNEKDSD
jgi:hypothetical protein